MSGNAVKPKRKPNKGTEPKPVRRKLDRRVLHTRDALGDALIALMFEKPFRSITVQQVLDRANVSRSTFYSHYRDKNDLFLSDVEDFLELMSSHLSRKNEASNRVAPVSELFAHVAEWRDFHAVLVKAGKIGDFQEMGQEYFARTIERRLAELPQSRTIPTPRRAALARMYAGGLMSLLSWWINCRTPESPVQMDHLYHQAVWSGILDRAGQSYRKADRTNPGERFAAPSERPV